MKKNGYLSIVILAIVTGVYNVIVFVAPFNKNANFWWAYGATMFALAFQIVFGLVAFGKAEKSKSKLLGIPVFYVGYIYLVLQLIAGFVFMLLPLQPWVSIIVYVILLATAIVCMIGSEVGRSYVNKVEEKTAAKVFYIKSIQAGLETLVVKTDNALIKQELKSLISAVKYSDPMSHESLCPLEEKIKEQVAELCEAVEIKEDGTAKSLISEISKLIIERNQKCKVLK